MPTENQELLLKSALLTGNECIGAFEKWSSVADIDLLDGGSQRLLPLALHNLKKYGFKNLPQIKKMKSVSIKTWYKNTLILNELSKILKKFNSEGIKTMVLKGIPITTSYYPNISLRPMGDFDILVPWKKSEAAGKILFSEGWELKTRAYYPVFHDSFKVTKNSYGFRRSGLECDLHWSIFKHTCYPGADSGLWERAEKIDIKGEKTLKLSPEDQLIHILEHGAYWSNPSSVRWVADAFLLLNNEKNLNWDYIIHKLGEKYLYPMMSGMFEYLNGSFDLKLPDNFINRLNSIPVNSIGKKLQNYTKVPRSEFVWRISNYFKEFLVFRIFLKDHKGYDKKNIVHLFIKFLFFRWEVKNPLLFPIMFFKRSIAKLSRYVKRKILRINYSGLFKK